MYIHISLHNKVVVEALSSICRCSTCYTELATISVYMRTHMYMTDSSKALALRNYLMYQILAVTLLGGNVCELPEIVNIHFFVDIFFYHTPKTRKYIVCTYTRNTKIQITKDSLNFRNKRRNYTEVLLREINPL